MGHHRTGFSLIEVLITTAIMAVVGLVFAGFIVDMSKQNRNMDAKSQLVDVVSEIRTELSSEAACLASFGGQNPSTGFNVTQLKDKTGHDSATRVPLQYGGVNRNLFTLTRMRVQDFNDAVTGLGDRIGSSNLVLTFDIGQNSVTTSISRPIRLHTEVNPAGAIVRCLALSGMTDGIWQKASTASQNIFYSAGNVGIGTDNPQGPLHVASGPIVQQSGDLVQNSAAGLTSIGTAGRMVHFQSNHASGYATVTGSGPSGSLVGFPTGGALVNGASLFIMNANNSGQTQIHQDTTGLRLTSHAGGITLQTPNDVTILPQGGSLQVGSAGLPASQRIISNAPSLLVLQRLGAGNLNTTIQYLNGSGKTVYAGMASDETFGIGPNPNLSSSDTWFEVNRSKGAQIRSFDPTVLMLTRTSPNMNTAVRYYNGVYNMYMGMTSEGDFAVDTDENLSTSPWMRFDRSENSLEVSGKIKSTKFIESSDARLKKDVREIEGSLEKILRLKGVEYSWIAEKQNEASEKDLGLIAQDVRDIFPEVVSEDDQGLLSIRYTALIAPLIESIRSLFQANEAQDLRMKEMEREIEELRQELRKSRTK